MKNLERKKVKDLTMEEREYLETTISGEYIGPNDKLVIGVNEATIDFENGLSVAGWIIDTGNEKYYRLNEEAVIYDASK